MACRPEWNGSQHRSPESLGVAVGCVGDPRLHGLTDFFHGHFTGLVLLSHFEEIGILREGIGPDRISDITAALLRQCAAWIDANPTRDASAVALRARLSAEQTATLTLDEVGRALGATPFCRDARFARAAADLPVFIRQSHAERDLAALGERSLEAQVSPWLL